MFCVTVSSNSCERTVTVPEVLKGRVIKLEQLDAKLPVRDIFARKIFDCRGNPTVETEVLAGENIVGRVSVPSGLIMAGLSDSGTTVKRQDEISALTDRMIENINTHIAQELTRVFWEQQLYLVYQQLQPVQLLQRSGFLCTATLEVLMQKVFRCLPCR